MSLRTYALGILCLATVTACAHPIDRALEQRAVSHAQGLQYNGKISAGACDDVGQFIPTDQPTVYLEASAAPK